ncbi:hypothetical protein CL652_02455 [bacterium]|nr:hypothetical protein [bacterium]
MFLELFIVSVLGLIIGSFLNVYILRLNTGRSATGRSGCMSCGERLDWRDLVPVFSFFVLRGRCTSCGSRISNQYWIVELTTAVVFVLVWLQGFSLLHTIFAFILLSLLIIIAVYDVKHTIIPNTVVYTFIALALISNVSFFDIANFSELSLPILLAVFSGAMVALPLFVLWGVSRGTWMGFGDVKLTFGFGVMIGIYDGLMAVMLGFILGAIIGVTLLHAPKVIRRLPLSPTSSRFTIGSEIPFAPFLILGFLLVFLFGVDILALADALI